MSLVAYVPTAWTDYADSPDLQAANLNHIELGIDAVTDELIAFEAWAAANFQPVSAELTAIAALSAAGYVKRTGSAAYSIVASIPRTDMATLPANTFIGNNTGSAATPLALTVAQMQTALGVSGGPFVRVSGDAMTGNLTIPTPNSALNPVSYSYIPNISSPFAQAVTSYGSHDWSAYTAPTQENTADGTTWNAVALNTKLFDAYPSASVEIINTASSVIGTRWTWNNTACSYITKVMLFYSWSLANPAISQLVEASADGITWTAMGSSAAKNTEGLPTIISFSNIQCSQPYFRLTIIATSGNGNLLCTSIQLWTNRIGDQGKGKWQWLPFAWDYNKQTFFRGNALPSTNNTTNLGGASNIWANAYVNNVLASNSIQMGGTTVVTSGRVAQNLTGITSSGTIMFSGLSSAGNALIGTSAAGVLYKAIPGVDYLLPSGSVATLTTGRTIGMTGDVVWTSPAFNGSANVTSSSTIQAGAVTLAKMATMPSGTMLGNVTGTDATPQALGFIQVRALLNLTGPFLTMTNPTWFGAAKTATGTLALEPLLSGGLLKATYGTGVIALADSYDVTAALGYVPLSGRGVAGNVPIWSTSSSLGSSSITDNGFSLYYAGEQIVGKQFYSNDLASGAQYIGNWNSTGFWALGGDGVSGSNVVRLGYVGSGLTWGSAYPINFDVVGNVSAQGVTISGLTGGTTRLATISPSGVLGAVTWSTGVQTIATNSSIGSATARVLFIASGVSLTLSGGTDGESWEMAGLASWSLVVPSGVHLRTYNNSYSNMTLSFGGGRPLRIIRASSSEWWSIKDNGTLP